MKEMRHSNHNPAYASPILVAFLLLIVSTTVFSQEPSDTLPDIPPPMRVASKDEREKLAAAADAKARIKLSLEFMESRIKLAEQALSRSDFNSVHRELGSFHFLMDDALRYLIRRDTGNDASGNNFKRYELALRAFVPRIELVRREVPLNYEPYVLTVLKRVREARSRAVEPLFAS